MRFKAKDRIGREPSTHRAAFLESARGPPSTPFTYLGEMTIPTDTLFTSTVRPFGRAMPFWNR